MYLNFKYQYHNLVAKLDEACASYFSKESMRGGCYICQLGLNLQAPLSHVPCTLSKVISTKMESIFVKTVKRLACFAKSTPTDLLISQGLYNIFNLQNVFWADFMQNCLQAVDVPCRLTSQISYTYLKYSCLKGVPPFCTMGLTHDWTEKCYSPLFTGVRQHLQTINMSLSVLFDTPISSTSVEITDTLAPIAYSTLTI